MPNVFFSRCKPQGADVIDVVLEHRRVFIGYPMHRNGAAYDPHDIHSCVVSPAAPEEEWRQVHTESDRRREYKQNRNLVARIQQDDLVLVPRPGRGVIYCGKIDGSFQLESDPPWYDQYMSIRAVQNCSPDSHDCWHAADIAQGWKVDSFRSIPVPKVPAWIRRSLFGRSTYGVIKPDDEVGVDPYRALLDIMDVPSFPVRAWTVDRAHVEQRLVNDLTPSTFEHLVVSLLQLETIGEAWSHIGGSGDGGIDGIGADQTGHVVALLQCKWQYWGGDPFAQTTLWNEGAIQLRKYLATLRHPPSVSVPESVIFLDRSKIAALIIKHADRLPLALSMRVGVPH